jgi:hypothetical protein
MFPIKEKSISKKDTIEKDDDHRMDKKQSFFCTKKRIEKKGKSHVKQTHWYEKGVF